MSTDQLLTRKAYKPPEVGAMLGVSASTIRRWIREGHLSTTTIAGQRYVTAAEIDRRLEEGQPAV